MAYGEIKVDTITFTDGGIDKSVSISGLVQNPTFSGSITVTGNISGDTLQGQTISGVTITGATAQFTSGTFISLTGTTTAGTTATYTTGSFTSLTGTTTSGTTANFVTGVFSTSVSGATVQGTAGDFTTITGGVTTITSGVFALGTNALPSISFSSDPNTGVYSPGADQVAISTNGTGRLFIDASGNINVGTTFAGFGNGSGMEIQRSTTATLRLTGSSGVGCEFYNTGSLASIQTRSTIPFTIQTNELERLRITTDGKLGLGTSSPSFPLDTLRSSAGTVARFQANGTDANVSVRNNAREGIIGSDTSQSYLLNSDAFPWTIWTNNLERLRIDSSGNVGIGTTDTNSLFSSGRNVKLSNTSGKVSYEAIVLDGTNNHRVGLFVDNGTGDLGLDTGSTSATYNGLSFYIEGSKKATIDRSGRLLVGTSSSTGANSYTGLVVKSITSTNSPGEIILQNGYSNPLNAGSPLGSIVFQDSSGDSYARIVAEVDAQDSATGDFPGRLVFSTTADGASSPTERMRITSNGVLFCGYDFRDATLGSTDQLMIGGNGYIAFHALNATAYTIGQNSDIRALRIGSGSGWATTGVSLAAGGTSWGTYSDERLKQDIAELDGCLDQLSGIRCVTYRLKDVDEADSKKRLGVIAQDLEGKFDEALNASRRTEDDENEYLSVQYADLVPVLIKSLQEAKERIEQLESEMAAVKAQLS